MLQVVKWYLSAFHAGRRSPVPKKPYNPVLGEVFQCWYNIPEMEADSVSFNSITRKNYFQLKIKTFILDPGW